MNRDIEMMGIPDTPIRSIDQDALGRGQFVDNVANLIKKRREQTIDCYTIGIYGEWGEGKSSVLNMICSEIEKSSDNKRFVIIRYNPWFFKDNESLILDFFRSLRVKKISADFTKKIKRYAPLVSCGVSSVTNLLLPGVGSAIKGVSENLIRAITDLDNDVVALKEKINESIKKLGKELLIVIDDVDRLDNDEVHALFKVIKQNADFINTTYLIAMDVEMVARSVASRFEDGTIISGRRFIEKIVQIPIHLPKIQQGQIHKLASRIIFKSLERIYSAGKGISTQPIEDVQSKFENYVFPLFTNIREINNYNNSLSVLLPLVYREILVSDLCMLEALKAFHPRAYYLIRDNKHVITGTELRISLKYFKENKDEKKQRKENFIKELLEDSPQNKKAYIECIIRELLGPFISLNTNISDVNSQKRLCSAQYFDKFFLFTNPEEFISNNESDAFFENLPIIKEDKLIGKLVYFYTQYGAEELTRVIDEALHMKYYRGINNDSIGKLCISLSKTTFAHKSSSSLDFDSDNLTYIYITELINNHINKKDNQGYSHKIISDYSTKTEIFKEIIATRPVKLFHINFAAYFYSKCESYYPNCDEIGENVYNLSKEYYNVHNKDIFNLRHQILNILFGLWKINNEEEYNTLIADVIFQADFNLEALIDKFIDPSEPDTFRRFLYLFDAQRIYDTITSNDYKKTRSQSMETFISRFSSHKALEEKQT